jgi:hypothetical protein
MVGAAPNAIRIVSIGIASSSQGGVALGDYLRGIRRCWILAADFNIRVINLSLVASHGSPSEQDLADLRPGRLSPSAKY